MNPFEFVLAIIIVTGVFSIIRARMGLPDWRSRRRGLVDAPQAEDGVVAARLRDEVRQLKERIQVLERITVEKENSLARQIDDLRDR